MILFCSCDLESIFQQIEWVTLLFFGSMFITMECLARLGLINWIGKQTEYLILLANEQMRLSLAIVIILWVNIDLCVFFFKLDELYLINKFALQQS